MARVGNTLGEDVRADAPNDAVGQHAASTLNANGFSTNEQESRACGPGQPTSRASRLSRFSAKLLLVDKLRVDQANAFGVAEDQAITLLGLR